MAPRPVKDIVGLFQPSTVRFSDGGNTGPAPKLPGNDESRWSKPSLVFSSPHKLKDAPVFDWLLAEILNVKHAHSGIGPASGLKMCLASTTKGFTAIAIQSFTTAQSLGVLCEPQEHLQGLSLKTGDLAAKGLVSIPPKAYR